MPGQTPNRLFPFPLAGESPAGHTQIQDLAMALDAVPKAGIGYCTLSNSYGALRPAKGSWQHIVYETVGGNHPEWGNAATGLITVPVAGIYSFQFSGACERGTGLVTWDITTTAINVGLFMQESSHSVDYGQPFVVSMSNLWECGAGDQISTSVFIQNHSVASPPVWGTFVVARVEGF